MSNSVEYFKVFFVTLFVLFNLFYILGYNHDIPYTELDTRVSERYAFRTVSYFVTFFLQHKTLICDILLHYTWACTKKIQI